MPMSSKLSSPCLSLSLLFFTSIFSFTGSDDVCPYPCYPPPTGTGTPTTQTPPAPEALTPPTPSGSTPSSYPPPGVYPSPSGNIPYYPSPPTDTGGGGGGGGGLVPPPPDPILPYFPFYYRKPPHKTDDEGSSAATIGRTSTVLIASLMLLCRFLQSLM